MRVFLGGTTNESTWRNRLIPLLDMDVFNPVVKDWTPAALKEENRQREACDVCLYTITPKMMGVYAIAEMVDDSHLRPARTFVVMLRTDDDLEFTQGEWRSLMAVVAMVRGHGVRCFFALEAAADCLNAQCEHLWPGA